MSFRAREEISRPFHFEIDLISTDSAIDATAIVGKPFTFWMQPDSGTVRYFHGLVNRWQTGPMQSYGARSYRAEVVPWLWFLSQTANCCVFQELTTEDILKSVFGRWSFNDYRFSLNGSYTAREYCVQYRETDFAFVSRLMEEEGMFYFFEHTASAHKLVIADASSVYADADVAEVKYAPNVNGINVIREWQQDYKFISGKWAHDDYNHQTPSTDLLGESSSLVSIGNNSKYEVYDYPGGFMQASAGAARATVRMEAIEATQQVATGSGTCDSFLPGKKFTFIEHHFETEDDSYLLTSVDHSATEGLNVTAGGGGSNSYSNSFTCIPADRVIRPERITRQPIVQGPQTAVVVGPSGQEIYIDDKGRAKVQFHWDRVGKLDEKSSCWVRVSNGWAGNAWGIMFHPRIGQEVVVDFLEGNPDRPLITGRVYNHDQVPDTDVAANASQSVIRTRSTPDGKADNFNELRFEDKKDGEKITFHAEKDFVRIVENNDSLKVGFEKHDKGDQTIDIYNNRTVTLEKGTDTLTIKEIDRVVNIDKGADKLTVSKGNRTVTISEGNLETTISKGNHTVTVSKGNQDVTVSQGNQTVTVSQGDQTITISAGKCTIEAGTSIELKVGSSSLKIESSAITISSSDISVKGQGSAEVASPSTTIKGDGTLTLKGGMVAIN
ncbi:MAG: type VI secretion system tip protein VgrG [Planctomycetaceae bacterium]|nr:type VI secretion system tip protein VgrG [Planctomycetaceae bacterium]